VSYLAFVLSASIIAALIIILMNQTKPKEKTQDRIYTNCSMGLSLFSIGKVYSLNS
jgi:hypothetical protein